MTRPAEEARRAAADLIRAAQAVGTAAGHGQAALETAVRSLALSAGAQVNGVSQGDRKTFVMTLALAAADFADSLPSEQRAAVFARLEASDAQLTATAVAALLRNPNGGPRVQ